MARNRFVAEILTPEGEVFNEEIEMLSTRTTVGSRRASTGSWFASRPIEPTELRLYRSETDIVRYAQAEGYVQMAENRALLLVEEAVDPAQLNAAELQERVAEAGRAIEAAPPGTEEAARAARDLRRAEAFLAIAGGAHQ
jgi:F-type H+-transporting ATPase subunit epsilon